MEKEPRCSVVLIAYNAQKYIKDTIESVLAQTMKDFELIIVNDCSTDKTEEIILSYSDERIRYFKNPQNLKISKTRNFGISKARAPYVALLDSDDVWMANKLEKQLKYMEKTGAKICYAGYGFINDDGELQNKVFNVPESVNYKKLLKQNVITPSASVFSTELLKKYPFYAEKYHEDFVAFLQMLKFEKIKAYGINEPLIYYRLTVNSKSRNKIRAFKMTMNSYKEIGLNFFQIIYYLPFYMINGLKKYRGIKNAKNKGYIKKSV